VGLTTTPLRHEAVSEALRRNGFGTDNVFLACVDAGAGVARVVPYWEPDDRQPRVSCVIDENGSATTRETSERDGLLRLANVECGFLDEQEPTADARARLRAAFRELERSLR